MKRLVEYWYTNHWSTYCLRPLAWLYRGIINLRRALYRKGWCRSAKMPVPVVVVGNITVGGTGKTPLVAWMAKHCRERGFNPGIVSRGYGGKKGRSPIRVMAHSDPVVVGDEAVMLVRQTQCPMVVSKDRVAAARTLLEHHRCDIVISDDGLQHYALQRDLEIAVIDGSRHLGNECCIPAGPLRESRKRLQEVDFVITNGKMNNGFYGMEVIPRAVYNLMEPEQVLLPEHIVGRKVEAVAGIGNPERFFLLLQEMGFAVNPHVFPDHYFFTPRDIDFGEDSIVIMTEKDAVKCQNFADARHWCLAVVAKPDLQFKQVFTKHLQQFLARRV